jgi:hypothetical protein
MSTAKRSTAATLTALAMAEDEPTDDWYLGWPMKARHHPPHVGTMIWTNRAALGAGGRNGTDRIIPRRDDESHRAGQ